ncbi:MAG TPA: peptide deformylase [Candidatus Binatia bacterium]|nr:peptide deformylase [Candidatus Binatia bacterium]
MALLTILQHPDPRLRQKAKPVGDFGPALQRLIDDMFETMYAAPGVGLAATQVGIAQHVAVIDCAEDKASPQPLVIVNAQIVARGERQQVEEGCLSVPGLSDRIERHASVTMRALDRHGQPFEVAAEGLLAQAIQHEIDHLEGKLYIDYLSSIKRERIRKKLEKEAKEARDRAPAKSAAR